MFLNNLTILNTYEFINNTNMINVGKNRNWSTSRKFFLLIKKGFYLKKDKYFFPSACVKITEGKVAYMHAQSHRTLRYMDGSPSGSSVHGIFQARILEWVAISFSKGSSQPRDQTHISCVSCIAHRFFTTEPSGKRH